MMKRSILYLDHDATCLRLFRDVVGDEYEVHTATTLSAARSALALRALDVVISEQETGESCGIDFLREVEARYPRSFRVLLTGALTIGDAIDEVSSGVVHILIPKPWTVEKMREVVELAELLFRFRAETQGTAH